MLDYSNNLKKWSNYGTLILTHNEVTFICLVNLQLQRKITNMETLRADALWLVQTTSWFLRKLLRIHLQFCYFLGLVFLIYINFLGIVIQIPACCNGIDNEVLTACYWGFYLHVPFSIFWCVQFVIISFYLMLIVVGLKK